MKKIFLLFVVAMFLAIGALQAQNATKSVVYLKKCYYLCKHHYKTEEYG